MPASIAHMLIAHNALTRVKTRGFKELADFDNQKARFREIVIDADLSCPLEKHILQKTREKLTSGPGGARYEPLFAQS